MQLSMIDDMVTKCLEEQVTQERQNLRVGMPCPSSFMVFTGAGDIFKESAHK